VAIGILAVASPSAVQALSTAQEELAEVRRSTPNIEHGAELFDTCAGRAPAQSHKYVFRLRPGDLSC